MKSDRVERLAAALGNSARGGLASHGLCSICREHLGPSGTGITLMTGVNTSQLCSSDARSSSLEDLQFTLGQGPSLDASNFGRFVIASDLTSVHATGTWPAFSAAAVQTGVRAVFAYPLRIGAAGIGVLTLYQEAPGSPTPGEHADDLVAAALVAGAILDMQARAPYNVLAEGLAEAGSHRAEVHQASGMISAQLGIGIVDALVRLRSHAYASNRSVGDVAADVVARRLRLQS